MSFLRRIMLLGLVAVLGGVSAVGLAACSDDDITGDDADEVELSVSERDLSPDRVEVDAGEIEFVVRNDGERVHAFAVETPDGVERTDNIDPGETGRITVELSEGSYRMYDPRGGYRNRGVSGTVVVRSDDDTDTVTERTVERTVVEDPAEDLPDVDEPEVQEPEVQEPPAAPPPPPPPATVTQTVPAPPPAETTP